MTSKKLLAEVIEKYENTYRKQTPKSQATTEAAKKCMPGGETRVGTYFGPYPIWIEKAEGCKITDLDGNDYIDFNNSFTTLALGHANPKTVEAVRQQVYKGFSHSNFMPVTMRWADLLCQRIESIDKIRFTNSGTEAVMMAIRAARAFTGKDKIIRIEGGFHGCYDTVVNPRESSGVPKGILADSITVPYNDKEAAKKAIVENKDQVAVMVVEGILGRGLIPPKEDYFGFLRRITTANNVLLLIDEVVSYRLNTGGMQRICGVKPDITTLAKIIGGGLPAGAFGGRADIMELFSPGENKIYHTGTFSGNPVSAAAGIATLEQLTTEEIDRINRLGELLAKGLREVVAKIKIKAQVIGWGSLQFLHFNTVPVVNEKMVDKDNKDIAHLLHLALMERGIFCLHTGLFNTSTPMTEKEIDTAINAVDDALTELKPHIERLWPELINH